MLRLTKFEKSYGSTPVLRIPDFIFNSDVYWIKGKNGSGKSTLLKSIAGIVYFQGDILLSNNISLKKHPIAYRKLISFSEAEPLFPEFLIGREMISLFESAKEAPKGQAEDYLESMKMKDFINNPIGSYSSGMVKKLSLVLAFLGNPKVILLDEPLITLDQDSLSVLYEWIAKKNRKENTAFFLSSHQDIDKGYLNESKTVLVQDQTITVVD